MSAKKQSSLFAFFGGGPASAGKPKEEVAEPVKLAKKESSSRPKPDASSPSLNRAGSGASVTPVKAPSPAQAATSPSQAVPQTPVMATPGSSTASATPARTAAASAPVDDDDEEPVRIRRAKKKVSYVSDDDGDDGEYVPEEEEESPRKKHSKRARSDSAEEEEESPKPKKAKKASTKASKATSKASRVVKEDEEMADAPALPLVATQRDDDTEEDGVAPMETTDAVLARFEMGAATYEVKTISNITSHAFSDQKRARMAQFKEKNSERYAWLQHPLDANKNPPGHPDYDPKTLYIPPSHKFSEFEKQYWEIKKNIWDTVLFFKKGKFFELYENDADIGARELSLKMTDRVNMRMAGVPEGHFGKWAAELVERGYKVARVDQLETRTGSELARVQGNKEDKLIRRALSGIYTAGTLVDESLLLSPNASYLMTIKEDTSTNSFGVVVLDASIGQFNMCSFQDDTALTGLETMLQQFKPREVIFEKGHVSPQTMNLIRVALSAPLLTSLHPHREFWDRHQTEDMLDGKKYFGDTWPEDLTTLRTDELAMSALGATVFYLQKVKLDQSLLSMRNFVHYNPSRHGISLILDGQALNNLEVLSNQNGGLEGTLYALLCRAVTPFGKRLFRQWLCHPLSRIVDITDRQAAVQDLMTDRAAFAQIQEKLKTLPDLERALMRIHTLHYKLKDFLKVLEGFTTAFELIQFFHENNCTFDSRALSVATTVGDVGFPDLTEPLKFFQNAFDQRKARTEDCVVPRPGVEPEYDEAIARVEEIDTALENHLREERKRLGVHIAFKHMNKETHQLEIDGSVKVPPEYELKSQTKGSKRYWTPFIQKQVAALEIANHLKNVVVDSLLTRMLQKFNEFAPLWQRAVRCLATIDALFSLTDASLRLGEPSCKPNFIESEAPVFDAKSLRHPCVAPRLLSGFIPNDVVLGGDKPAVVILTGPNMGGKSTLLRQTCLAIVMAQVGCYVAAESCTLTPTDRIFTRIGAHDNIMLGQSTFMVEMRETSLMLNKATRKSMVVLDELGRGTSTFDGYSIAYAVLHHVARHLQCRTLFATHYSSLCDEFSTETEVGLRHMALHLDPKSKDVTFLYKLTEGVCPKSYGMKVARMAGITPSVVDRADFLSAQFEVNSPLVQYQTANAVPLRDEERAAARQAAGVVKDMERLRETVLASRRAVGK